MTEERIPNQPWLPPRNGAGKMSFEVLPSIIEGRFIKLETRVNDVRQDFYSHLIDTQEKAVHEALIKLGWTPPDNRCPEKSDG